VSAAASAVVLAASKHRSSQHNSPACNLGLPHILHWRPSLRNTDSHRSTLAPALLLEVAALELSAPVLEALATVWAQWQA